MSPKYKPRVKQSRKAYKREWELDDDVITDGDLYGWIFHNTNKTEVV